MDQNIFNERLNKVLGFILETNNEIRKKELFRNTNPDPDTDEIIYKRTILAMKKIYYIYNKMDDLIESEKDILSTLYFSIAMKLEALSKDFTVGFNSVGYSDIGFTRNFEVHFAETIWDKGDGHTLGRTYKTPIYTEEDGFNDTFINNYIRHNK